MKMLFAALGAACLSLSAGLALADDRPTDPQIAHIAYTAGVIDIAAAELALSKTADDDVRAFAQSMLDDHKAVNDQALELVGKLGVTPEDNPTSQALVAAADAKRAELAALDGTAFDAAYINNEVDYHAQVLAALDGLLIPSAQNAELKSLLETGYKLFQGHQQHAEHVVEALK
ncbi:DUF4142 domain-containing protein [Paracoccus caeni]|uniref:DUF4142 domain-containing protein n=1 Tax=Paracoccus caeni TaxID=657651 RepID=A0A934SI53_9RHOB|nr:DUF4142 domain-containing protein [Paracoccus caeni]MBK4215599.1 DUF4142 domain-containing protein [Paracoccus caeni]